MFKGWKEDIPCVDRCPIKINRARELKRFSFFPGEPAHYRLGKFSSQARTVYCPRVLCPHGSGHYLTAIRDKDLRDRKHQDV